MQRSQLPCLAFLTLCVATALSWTPPAIANGHLVIVGGGGTPESVIVAALRLAGSAPEVLVIPQASSATDAGQSSAKMFLDHGARSARVLQLEDSDSALLAIESSDLIWFPGGQQSQLIAALRDAGLVEPLRKKFLAGGVFGGTSAGAAVMSREMIPRMPKTDAFRAHNTPIMEGLALTEDLIIDQHFVKRRRMNRLLSAVLDFPTRIGVGIGERTAIVLHNGQFHVLGEGTVIVIDARQSTIPNSPSGDLQRASQVSLHVLAATDRFRWQPATD